MEAAYGDGPLLRDEVDAKQAYYVDEYVRLKTGGNKVDALRYKDWGHKAYSQVMFVSETTLAHHREALIRFLQMLDREWVAAVADPETTARLVVETFEPELDLGYQTASLKLMPGVAVGGRPSHGRDAGSYLASEHGCFPQDAARGGLTSVVEVDGFFLGGRGVFALKGRGGSSSLAPAR
ncbi:MAG: ABC transporter substrate-binding protein [Candidatus Synoicihabitans palmerolidicus]|nr:ABC transporter substrate-binding protein [Candidatus Synoicihabitans palmerolidicus]